jgi:UDP-N-acetylmuramyl tripeptide synthase
MSTRIHTVIALSKLARSAARLRSHGGSALPGLVAETLAPDFLEKTLSHLPDGVVIVTGTNGKTTTTKMIADLMRGLGKHVLTNGSGSNFTRGIAATIIKETKLGRKLPHDIAVIELDEAYAKRFVGIVSPRYVVALNVIRDQLDRFGEIDTTARLIESVLQAATGACVINGDDPRLTAVGQKLAVPVHYYTVSEKLRPEFPTDEELLAIRDGSHASGKTAVAGDVELTRFSGRSVSFLIDGQEYETTLNVTGQYNFQNAAAAITLARLVAPDIPVRTILEKLSVVNPAFGRGETMKIDGQDVEIILVKNPAGFRQSLKSFNTPAATMIAINDNYADGRDVSWLWDVTFESLRSGGVHTVSGIRASDMALRLQYDDVKYERMESDLHKALAVFMRDNKEKPKRIFCTYTAMLPLHADLSKRAGRKRAL